MQSVNMQKGYLVLSSLLGVRRVYPNLLVILLERSKILTRFRELALLHTFTNVPVDKGTLRVEEIEFMVETAPCAGDGRRVRQHAHAAGHLGEITTGDMSGWLIADTELEAGGAPIHELNGPAGLDNADSRINVLGNDITTVEQSTCHW
jgi:hypothetical protein